MRPATLLIMTMLCTLLYGCEAHSSDKGATGTSDAGNVSEAVSHLRAHIASFNAKAEHKDPIVKVQHILIAFKGSLPDPRVQRSKDEAEALTAEILANIERGQSFDALVKQYTNDSYPGIYSMSLSPSTLKERPGVMPRNGMVPAFGNAGWRLQPGDVGVAGYDPVASPYGWHIVKRLE